MAAGRKTTPDEVKPKTRGSLTMEDWLYQALQTAAQKAGRTFSQEIRYRLKQSVEAEQQQ
jgi:hypothetical protein